MPSPLRDRVRSYLAAHPSQSFTPTQVAKALREHRIRVVRSACVGLREAREAVSCEVMRSGKRDELFRIVGGGPQLTETSRSQGHVDAAEASRRGRQDGSPKAEASAGGSSTGEAGVNGVARALVGPSSWRHPRGGRPHTRQREVLQFLRSIDRPAFPREAVEHVRRTSSTVSRDAVYSAIGLLKRQGLIVICDKARDADSPYFGRVPRYATPEVAARERLEFSQGNGGEAGNGEAGREPAALSGDEATRPSAEKTTPSGAGDGAGPQFGLLSDGALLMRGVFPEDVKIPAPGARALIAWFDRLSGSCLSQRLYP